MPDNREKEEYLAVCLDIRVGGAILADPAASNVLRSGRGGGKGPPQHGKPRLDALGVNGVVQNRRPIVWDQPCGPQNLHCVRDGDVQECLLHIVEVQLGEVHLPVLLGGHAEGLLRCLLSLPDRFECAEDCPRFDLCGVLSLDPNEMERVPRG